MGITPDLGFLVTFGLSLPAALSEWVDYFQMAKTHIIFPVRCLRKVQSTIGEAES
jgi:hypothetical protein